MKLTGILAVLAWTALPAMAIDTPHLAGDFQGWDPGADAMTETGVDTGIYEAIVSGLDPSSRHEFKITNGTWDETVPGPNSWFFADGAGDITITYDSNTYDDGWSPSVDRLILSTDPGTWTAVGNFQSFFGGGDWDNANPFTAMTPMGGGIYMFEATGLPEGTYDWKAVVTGSWDAISWDARSVNAANMQFTIDGDNPAANLYVDSFGGTVKVELIPEPASLLGLTLLGLLIRRR